MAGLVGLEPTDAGIKTPCLTTWRQPNERARILLIFKSLRKPDLERFSKK